MSVALARLGPEPAGTRFAASSAAVLAHAENTSS